MTRKTNRCPAFMEGRGTRCLKIAAVATLLLWCTQPMQAVANTNETQETTDIQQQKVKTTGVVVDENGEPLIGVSVKVQGTATGTVTDLNGRFSIDSPKGVQSPNQKIPDRKTKCVIKTHINIKQNVIFGAKLKPV